MLLNLRKVVFHYLRRLVGEVELAKTVRVVNVYVLSTFLQVPKKGLTAADVVDGIHILGALSGVRQLSVGCISSTSLADVSLDVQLAIRLLLVLVLILCQLQVLLNRLLHPKVVLDVHYATFSRFLAVVPVNVPTLGGHHLDRVQN